MSRTVNCPTCGTTVEWIEKNISRPFCSERCKLIDLGAWASESYRVVADEDNSLIKPAVEPRHPFKSS